MTAPLTCAEAQELVPELAVGLLGGHERAAAVAHLASCSACRELSEDLVGVVDELTVLAPPAEPPAGFESRVIAAMSASPSGHPHRRVIRGLAVAALVAVFAAGALLGSFAQRQAQGSGPAPRGAPAVREAALVGGSGSTWGEAYVSAGAEPWVFVTMRWDLPDSRLTVELSGPRIPSVRLDGLELVDGRAALGRNVAGNLSNVRTVRILDDVGHELCRATLS